MFAGVSTDVNPAHLDEEYAKGTQFGGRIAHGMPRRASFLPCSPTSCRVPARSISARRSVQGARAHRRYRHRDGDGARGRRRQAPLHPRCRLHGQRQRPSSKVNRRCTARAKRPDRDVPAAPLLTSLISLLASGASAQLEGREPLAGMPAGLQDRIPGTPGADHHHRNGSGIRIRRGMDRDGQQPAFIGLKSVSPEAFVPSRARSGWKRARTATSRRSPAARRTVTRWPCGCFRVPHSKAPGRLRSRGSRRSADRMPLRRAEILPLRAVERTGAAVDALSAADQRL